MKTEHDDSLTKTLARLQQTVSGEDHAVTESSRPPVSCDSDIGELFLAELEARRERLRHWISLLSEEAHLSGGGVPVVRGSRHKCRSLALPPRAKRRLGARRHSTAA
jgi:hypothetical protein